MGPCLPSSWRIFGVVVEFEVVRAALELTCLYTHHNRCTANISDGHNSIATQNRQTSGRTLFQLWQGRGLYTTRIGSCSQACIACKNCISIGLNYPKQPPSYIYIATVSCQEHVVEVKHSLKSKQVQRFIPRNSSEYTQLTDIQDRIAAHSSITLIILQPYVRHMMN